ncbi:helix-turn-helix transcriptional regulator, partial [Chloroflexota bacterium]
DKTESREKINAVQRMQDFIEQYITKPITMYMVARASGYSPWYSARVFKELTGKTPFEYIRALRLSRAAIKLRDEDVRIIDVALDFVFETHEGFTRAFTKHFGVSPSSYRKNVFPAKPFMPERIRDYHHKIQTGEDKVANISDSNTVFVQVIDRPKRKLILKRGIKATHYFEYCEEVGCEIWSILANIKEAMYEPIGMWLPENMRLPNTSVYAQGVEVPYEYTGKAPEGLELVDLPPCKMMVFQGPPYDDDDFEQAIGNLWKVMKSYNPELYGFSWADEDGPRFQLEPWGYRGYIEAKPVRPVNKK